MPPRTARDLAIAPPSGYGAVPGQPWNVTPTTTTNTAPAVPMYGSSIAQRAAAMRGSGTPTPVASAGNDPGWSGMGGQQAAQLTQANNAFVQNYNAQLAAGGGAAAGAGGDPNVANARNQMFGLATNNLNSLQNNPVDQQVLAMLQARTTNGPYNAQTINALQTGAAQQQGQMTQNAIAQLGRSGLSPTDPAYQSQMTAIQNAQGASAQNANLGIQQNANIENYNAAGQAIGQYGGYNTNRLLNINQASNYLGGLYGQVFAATNQRPAQGANYNMPNYGQWSQAMQGGQSGGYVDPYGNTPSPTYAPGSPSAPSGSGMNSMSYTAGSNQYNNGSGYGAVYGGGTENNPTAAGGASAAQAYINNGGLGGQTQEGGTEAANAYRANTAEDRPAAASDKYLQSYLQRTSSNPKIRANAMGAGAGYSNQAS